jgi:riboflavin biosynthesis pyrimidine reductase
MQTTPIMGQVAYERIKTEHAGAKNGGGAWMTRAEAKQMAKRQRRQTDEIETALSTDERDNRWATANAREAIREEPWQSKIGS